jgi:hypothetical protein
MVSAYRPVTSTATGVILPLCPVEEKTFEAEVYRRFIRLFSESAGTLESRILSSIQLAAEAVGLNPAIASKMLVDMGLRAERAAFPPTFLDWSFVQTPPSILSLRHYWDRNAATRRSF